MQARGRVLVGTVLRARFMRRSSASAVRALRQSGGRGAIAMGRGAAPARGGDTACAAEDAVVETALGPITYVSGATAAAIDAKLMGKKEDGGVGFKLEQLMEVRARAGTRAHTSAPGARARARVVAFERGGSWMAQND